MSLGPNRIGTLPAPGTGIFVTVAHLTAKGPDEMKTLLSILYTINESANSDAEPDCIGVCYTFSLFHNRLFWLKHLSPFLYIV